ncbi:SDR family NAD(P)-dependent oxidoreductase [Arthrobacter sp. MMS18-M83]|uniref:SDR family NAD(P)-dependent oxidoreductase n=1 Tax=Arthrobacter sp. MMS18-M83 TaxID=2996261 RepID=UPI00227B15EF|nr:SDR family oxidoreductase [Arthrobacter sp. MMS18-M83]WAH97565.1 SDR family oxidoreductase [Arthrobacter sp. MMS18-M83]
MTENFQSRVAVVTGAGRGLGEAVVDRLVGAGARVVVVDREGDDAAAVAGRYGSRAISVQADVSTEAGVERYIAAGLDAFDRIDMHHLNVGIVGSPARLVDLSLDDFRRVMEVNVVSTFLGIRAALRQFESQGGGGTVLATCSISGTHGSHDIIPYQASKGAVLSLLRGSAMYGAPIGVGVNGIAPGLIATQQAFDGVVIDAVQENLLRRGGTVPLRRAGHPGEIADAAAFLLSDRSSYITGQLLYVDGGASQVCSVRGTGGAGAWDTAPIDDYVCGR